MTLSKDNRGFAERLPWGNTEQVLPLDLMLETDHISLEKQAKAYKQIKGLRGLYDETFNHQEMRPLSFTKVTSFWMYVFSFGKGLSMIMVVGVIFVLTLFFLEAKGSHYGKYL